MLYLGIDNGVTGGLMRHRYQFLVTIEDDDRDQDYPFTEADVQDELQTRLEAIWTHADTRVERIERVRVRVLGTERIGVIRRVEGARAWLEFPESTQQEVYAISELTTNQPVGGKTV